MMTHRQSMCMGVMWVTLLATLAVAGAAPERGALPIDVAAVSSLAGDTKDPAHLKWALETLILHASPQALAATEAVLTTNDRLVLIDGELDEMFDDTVLFGILRRAAEALDGKTASELLLAVSRSEEYYFDTYEKLLRERTNSGKVWTRTQSREIGRRVDRLYRRNDALMVALGYIRGPTPEVIELLGANTIYPYTIVLARPPVIRALMRIGTEEAFAALLDSKARGPVSDELAKRRNEPRMFQCLVDLYMDSTQIQSRAILEKRMFAEFLDPLRRDTYLPEYGVDTLSEDSRAFVTQMDRLLDYKGHRPLMDEEREMVSGVREDLDWLADQHERRLKEAAEGAEGADE